MIGDLSANLLVWAAIVLTGVVAVVILVVLLSSDSEQTEPGDGLEVELPVEMRQLAVLERIDRKLRVVHLVAILALVGWLFSCLAVAIGLAIGPVVLLGDLLRRLLPWG